MSFHSRAVIFLTIVLVFCTKSIAFFLTVSTDTFYRRRANVKLPAKVHSKFPLFASSTRGRRRANVKLPSGEESHSSFSLFASSTDTEETSEVNGKRYRPGSMAAAIQEKGTVPYGESSRKYRRTVFTHDDWLEHRSSGRSIENLKGIFFSGIVRQMQQEVLLVSSAAVAVVLWNSVLVPSGAAAGMLPSVSLPSLPFTLSSPALGLLLVFRTNSSYARWLEARVKWGTIITQSRNMVRMATTFCDVNDPKARKALEYLALSTWTFSRTFMNALSGPEDNVEYEEELHSAYPDGSSFVTDLLSTPDRSIAALTELSLALDAIPIDEKRRVEIDKSIVIIGDCVGACERIFTSPVPLVYTRHTARFLTLWMLLVPAALYDTFASVQAIETLFLVPAVAIMSLFLFGIEELAVQLEEPFSILPQQQFCNGIRSSTEEMIDWRYSRSADSGPREFDDYISESEVSA